MNCVPEASLQTEDAQLKAAAPSPPVPAIRSGLRVRFLDGIRGLAALYVVIHHAYLEVAVKAQFSELIHRLGPINFLFDSGKLAVDIFIVLSGYALMLPVVRAGGRIRSLPDYIRRRCRRILPPYYAAVAFSLILIAFVPGLSHPTGAHWDVSLPAFRAGPIISHLLLVQNLSPDWAYQINHALWSVATECQIYVIFPALLLPLWRRFGLLTMIAGAFAATVPLSYIRPELVVGRLWYAGLFAMGAAGAVVATANDTKMKYYLNRVAWLKLALASLVAAAALLAARNWVHDNPWVADTLIGLATMCVIVACAHNSQTRDSRVRGVLIAIFESPIATALGVFSYSLYLVHPPIVAICNQVLSSFSVRPSIYLPSMILLGTLASLLVAAIFYWAVERWCVPPIQR